MKSPVKPATPKLISVVLAAFLLLASLVGIAQINAPDADNTYQDYVHSVETLTLPTAQPLIVEREFSGRVEAIQILSLGFELSGTLAQMNVNDGDFVKKGQLLAQLDTQLLQADLDKLTAQYKQASALLTLNQQTLERQQALKSQNYSAEQQLDELQAEQQQLQANLQLIKSQQQQAHIRIKKSSLFAPFEGQISKRYRVNGAVIAPSEPVVEIVQDRQLHIRVSIPLTLARQLTIGDAITINTLNKSQGLQFNASIESISRSINTGSYTQTLRLRLPDTINKTSLSNGQIVLATLSQQRDAKGYWLPSSALTEGLRGTWNILVLGEAINGKQQIHKVAVDTLYFQHDKVFIAASDYLPPQTQVIKNGTQRISNLQWVAAQ